MSKSTKTFWNANNTRRTQATHNCQHPRRTSAPPHGHHSSRLAAGSGPKGALPLHMDLVGLWCLPEQYIPHMKNDATLSNLHMEKRMKFATIASSQRMSYYFRSVCEMIVLKLCWPCDLEERVQRKPRLHVAKAGASKQDQE